MSHSSPSLLAQVRMSLNNWVRYLRLNRPIVAAILATWTVYLLAIGPLYLVLGNEILLLSLLAVVATAGMLGMPAGVLSAFVVVGLTMAVLRLAGAEEVADAVVVTYSLVAVALGAGVGWLHDVREGAARQMAERIRAEERYRTLFDGVPVGLYLSTPDGRILDANPALVQLLGYPDREALMAIGAPNVYARPEDRQRWQSLLERDGVARDFETQWLRRDGTSLWIKNSARVVRDQAGRVVRHEGSVEDFTERRRAEDEVRQLNEELERRVRERTAELVAANEELEAFAYSVSHDLRTPLRAIHGFSSILTEEYAPSLPELAQGYLRRVRNGAQQMDTLIADLLAFSRLGRGALEKRRVEPADIARQVLDGLSAEQEGRDVAIVLGNLPPCQADPTMLRQVFSNLLGNALKFTRHRAGAWIEIGYRADGVGPIAGTGSGEGGRVGMGAGAEEGAGLGRGARSDEDAGIDDGAGPGAGVYFVRDNGVGFDMQYAHKLFGVFQRLHRAEDYEGTGVGLAIVQRVIRRHGGRVWAEGQIDQGATFYFTLEPALPEE